MAKAAGPRALAANTLVQVIDRGQSLSQCLPVAIQQLVDSQEAGLLQELCYGSLRWYLRLQAIAERLLQRPFKQRDRDIHCLILVGLYQLLYMDKPAHAVVNETVAACDQLDKSWARGVVNAVLRNSQRRHSELEKMLAKKDSTATAHPDWLFKALQSDWPDDSPAIVEANNQRPPMTLRVNRQKNSANEYLQLLEEQGLSASDLPGCADAIALSEAVRVENLPGFSTGYVSVQDAAAQFTAHLLDAQAGDRVLDACAAPGGKTCHILERQANVQELIALDIAADRLERIKENLTRLQLQASLVAADAADTESWWDGRLFQRILLDAPCSATGVIRRHPDIRVLRRASDIEPLVQLQQQLLRALWSILAPGGVLLYATCSVLLRENVQQLQTFMNNQTDCTLLPIDLPVGRAMAVGWQILPGEGGMDGFYYALLQKAVVSAEDSSEPC